MSLGNEGSNFVKVVDFGGGGGNAFRLAESIITRKIDSWTVIETQPMVNACESLAGDVLKFVTLDQLLGNFELGAGLLYSFCALHYTEEPLEIFEKLLTLKPKVVCMSRIALSTNDRVIEIAEFSKLSSNGPGSEVSPIEDGIVRYPSRAVPQNDFEDKLRQDYKIISRIDHGTSMAHRAAGAKSARLFSYLAILKQS
jgi:putative methyltransferase (TIGR04325 family)